LARLVHQFEPGLGDGPVDERLARLREQLEELKAEPNGRPLSAPGPSASSPGLDPALLRREAEASTQTPSKPADRPPSFTTSEHLSGSGLVAGATRPNEAPPSLTTPPPATASGSITSSAPVSPSGLIPSSASAMASGPIASSAPATASAPTASSAPGTASGPISSTAPASAPGHMASSAPATASGPVASSAPATASGPIASSAPVSASGPVTSSSGPARSAQPGFLALLGDTPQDRFGLILMGVGLVAVLYAVLSQLHLG
jgi:hypothetical protein